MERVITLKRDNKLEIVKGNMRGEVHEDKRGILYDDLTFEPLSDEEMKEMSGYKANLRQKLVDYYNNLLRGEEEVLILKTGEKESPYILTSETLMSEGWESPKYAEVFETAFGPAAIKKLGIDSKVEGISDALDVLSKISYRNKVTKVKLPELFSVMNKKRA